MARNKEGITLITIVVSILIMLLILSTIVISAKNIYNDTKKKQIAREMNLVQSSWETYIVRNSGKTGSLNMVDLTIANLASGTTSQFSSEPVSNGKIRLVVIDLDEIDVDNVTYGNGEYGTDDRYLVSLSTGKVYYEKGFVIAGETYYTITAIKKVETNIDETLPTVIASDGGSTSSSVTIVATASDEGGTLLNTSSYQYSKDGGTTWTAATSATSYTFTGLTTGTYQCKAKVANVTGNVAMSGVISVTTAELGTVGLVATPTAWTNGNVTVAITYPSEVVTKQYSLDGTTWSTYTTSLTISTNNTTVYAKGLDAGGNQTAQATLTVANIDKTVPTVTIANGGVTTSSITVVATASDLGASGLNTSSYQYSKDGGATWTSATSATSYTFSPLTTGTYQCKVKVADNAGSVATSVATAITTTGLGTIEMAATPTTWTNGDVTVTITYPPEIVTKQYSTNGTTWSTYTTSLTISTNNTTVYAKGLDAGGNQTAQATLTVANIDKTLPVITAALSGSIMYADPTFASGMNSTGTYNNLGNGNVIRTRLATTTPTGSGYAIEIKTIGTAVPENGGFYFATPTAANKVYITRIIAKIPLGYTINWHSNQVGTGASTAWLTSRAGTGDWAEYVFKVICGSTGAFSSTNFFALSGTVPTPEAPLIWYVAYATVVDTAKWSPNNTLILSGTDNAGIAGYGINQSATVPPTYTPESNFTSIGKSINMTENGTYYAWIKDVAGNEKVQSFVVDDVVDYTDNIAPTVTATNGGTTSSSITITAVAGDTGGSGVNTGSYQYSKDNGATWTASTTETSYTFTSLTAGTYQCRVRLLDNAGNIAVSAAVAITI